MACAGAVGCMKDQPGSPHRGDSSHAVRTHVGSGVAVRAHARGYSIHGLLAHSVGLHAMLETVVQMSGRRHARVALCAVVKQVRQRPVTPGAVTGHLSAFLYTRHICMWPQNLVSK